MIPLASRLSRTVHPLIRAGRLGLLLFLSAPLAPGQTPLPERTGSVLITGRVSNGGTKEYLEGALVVLKPGDQSVLTTGTGEFLFSRVPAGDYTLAVSYAGLDPKTVGVTVGPNGRSENDVQLTSEIYKLEKFVVAGEREGNAAAITQQRNADNIKTVMASDAFGNVADLNIVNFLMRMPGVTKTEVEGEPSGFRFGGSATN